MRGFISILATAAAIAAALPVPAEALAKGIKVKRDKQLVRVARRPASVGPDGLCQRDTGTPTSRLSFRNVCDTEEFWRRTMEQGTGHDR